MAIALLLAVVIKTYAIQAFWIPSGSMENTLEINDRVLVNKMIYHIRDIHRGDIVVFNGDGSWEPGAVPVSGNIFQQFADGFSSMFGFGHPGDILIKRVIGLPGDRVACCDAQGRVTVNGVPLNEQSYLYPGAAPSLIRFNIVVPPGRRGSWATTGPTPTTPACTWATRAAGPSRKAPSSAGPSSSSGRPAGGGSCPSRPPSRIRS